MITLPIWSRRSSYLGIVCLLLLAAFVIAQTQFDTIDTITGTGDSGYSSGDGVASSAQIELTYSIAADGFGNVYIADSWNHRIRKVTPDGSIENFAGDGTPGSSGENGPATAARLKFPRGLAVDASGSVFVSDSGNGVIRKIGTDGVIRIVAGNGQIGYQGDGGPATGASFRVPRGLAVDAGGNLYIADSFNARIRKVGTDGQISTFAGTGRFARSGDGGPATEANIGFVHGLAFDANGNLYFSDTYNHCIRRITADGIIDTVAGTGEAGFSGDSGPAASAALNLPRGLSFDAAGNLFFADSGNNRVRKVTPAGIISTVAGDGTSGFAGDGGLAISAQLQSPVAVALDAAGNLLVADSLNYRIRKITLSADTGPAGTESFSVTDRGAASTASRGISATTTVGYARIRPDDGSTTPSGVAIFGFTQNGVLVTEAGVPAAALVEEGRIFAEVDGPIGTGLAIANPNDVSATISFYFTDTDGTDFGSGSLTLEANEHISKFLNEAPFNSGESVLGTFTFTSSIPVAAIALRTFVNERDDFLITTLPVASLSPESAETIYFPQYADGGGATTEVVLVNPTNATISGTVQFWGQGSDQNAAEPVSLALDDGSTGSEFNYSIPPRSSTRLRTANPEGSATAGSVRVTRSAGTSSPSGVAIFSINNLEGFIVSQASVAALPVGTAFRLYVEALGTPGQIGSLRSGLAITDTSSSSNTITLELTSLDGTTVGEAQVLSLPPSGHISRFLDELFSLSDDFSGVLRITSSSQIAMVGLRGRTNERGDFLLTTTPPSNEADASTSADLFFPQIADSGGWTTQFVLFSGSAGQASSGTLDFFNTDGNALDLALQ